MRQYGGYIFDLDGTLFRGNEALPGAVETVAELRRRGAAVRYLTNNSSLTREAYLKKLRGMGFEAGLAEVYSSAIGTASYCLDEGLGSAFVVGEPGLVATLKDAGIRVLNADEQGLVCEEADPARAVVVGIHKSFNYQIASGAMQQILQGARFLATNRDATYPLEGGRLIPGAGAIVAAIATCSGEEPVVIGKPNPFLVEFVIRESGLSSADMLVVGDRYETDIESGRRAGCDTHLVLTGVTKTPPEGQSWSEDLRGLL